MPGTLHIWPVTSELILNFERQAELHEQDAAAIAGEAASVDRRADLAAAIAELKDKQAALEKDQSEAARLRFESNASRREAGVLKSLVGTLLAERNRAIAQAQTARKKCEMARMA